MYAESARNLPMDWEAVEMGRLKAPVYVLQTNAVRMGHAVVPVQSRTMDHKTHLFHVIIPVKI